MSAFVLDGMVNSFKFFKKWITNQICPAPKQSNQHKSRRNITKNKKDDQQKLNKKYITELKRIISEGLIIGGHYDLRRYLHEKVLDVIIKEWKSSNPDCIFEIITNDNYIASTPTTNMQQQLEDAFHGEWEHNLHPDSIHQLKQKVENYYHKIGDIVNRKKVIVIAYLINVTHFKFQQNLVHAQDWNQFHTALFGLIFCGTPDAALPFYVDPNGSKKDIDPNHKSMYKIYNIILCIKCI